MDKKRKAELLARLAKGQTNIDEIKKELTRGLCLKLIIWDEISPGVFEDKETGRTVEEGDKFVSEAGELDIFVRLFDHNGKLVPPLARSEKEVIDRMRLEEPEMYNRVMGV